MGSHSATVLSAALTAITRSAASTITIPGKTGQMNTLVAIEAQAFGTLESAVVGAGGLVELENDGIDWIPLNFYTEYNDAVTSTSSGAAEILTTKFKVNQKLPAGSIVSCYFTPIDNQSLKFSVTIHWIEGGPSGSLTYMKGGKGSAVTAATKASDHITIAVPSGKGGKLKAIWAVPIGIMEVAGTASSRLQAQRLGERQVAECKCETKAQIPVGNQRSSIRIARNCLLLAQRIFTENLTLLTLICQATRAQSRITRRWTT